MNRRGFLGTLATAFLARKLPALAPPVVTGPKFIYAQYGLGFKVSKELIEDTIYSPYLTDPNTWFMIPGEQPPMLWHDAPYDDDVDP